MQKIENMSIPTPPGLAKLSVYPCAGIRFGTTVRESK